MKKNGSWVGAFLDQTGAARLGDLRKLDHEQGKIAMRLLSLHHNGGMQALGSGIARVSTIGSRKIHTISLNGGCDHRDLSAACEWGGLKLIELMYTDYSFHLDEGLQVQLKKGVERRDPAKDMRPVRKPRETIQVPHGISGQTRVVVA
jgi:hypothetical protein